MRTFRHRQLAKTYLICYGFSKESMKGIALPKKRRKRKKAMKAYRYTDKVIYYSKASGLLDDLLLNAIFSDPK